MFLVPEVQFTESHYSIRFPNSSISLCLMYNNTGDGVYFQFNVEVLIQDVEGTIANYLKGVCRGPSFQGLKSAQTTVLLFPYMYVDMSV